MRQEAEHDWEALRCARMRHCSSQQVCLCPITFPRPPKPPGLMKDSHRLVTVMPFQA